MRGKQGTDAGLCVKLAGQNRLTRVTSTRHSVTGPLAPDMPNTRSHGIVMQVPIYTLFGYPHFVNFITLLYFKALFHSNSIPHFLWLVHTLLTLY